MGAPPATLEAFADTPAQIAGSPAELAAASDLVCLCVVGDADIDELTGGEGGLLSAMKPGGIIAVHSTVHPETCRELAKRAGAVGVSIVDAPVSGGGGAAAEGRLLVMAGGDTEAVERCRPVFETYADPVVHLGELGSGQTTKLLNNLLFTANLATAATALSLADALGVTRSVSPRSSPAAVETALRSMLLAASAGWIGWPVSPGAAAEGRPAGRRPCRPGRGRRRRRARGGRCGADADGAPR